jgi:hypothetical protein
LALAAAVAAVPKLQLQL